MLYCYALCQPALLLEKGKTHEQIEYHIFAHIPNSDPIWPDIL